MLGTLPQRPSVIENPGSMVDGLISPALGLLRLRGRPRLFWTAVWASAVVVPAWRRATATWLGCAIVAGVVFGPTGMRPSVLTGLVLQSAGAAAVVGVTWLLMFVPTARLIMQPPA